MSSLVFQHNVSFRDMNYLNIQITFCQSSSVVEQRTHKPLVGSSNLPFGTIFYQKSLSTIRKAFFVCGLADRI